MGVPNFRCVMKTIITTTGSCTLSEPASTLSHHSGLPRPAGIDKGAFTPLENAAQMQFVDKMANLSLICKVSLFSFLSLHGRRKLLMMEAAETKLPDT